MRILSSLLGTIELVVAATVAVVAIELVVAATVEVVVASTVVVAVVAVVAVGVLVALDVDAGVVVVVVFAVKVVVVVGVPVYGVVVVKKPRSCSLQVAFEHHAVGSPSPTSPKCSCLPKLEESRMVNQKTKSGP